MCCTIVAIAYSYSHYLLSTAVTAVATVVSAGIIFFIIVLIFTSILTAAFYRKIRRETVEHLQAIYEPIDLPSIPPQLPPRQPHQVPMLCKTIQHMCKLT